MFATESKTTVSQSDPYYNNFLYNQKNQNLTQNLNNFYTDYNTLNNNNLVSSNYSIVNSQQQPQFNFNTNQQNNLSSLNLSQNSLNQQNNLQNFSTNLHSSINPSTATQLQPSYVTSANSIFLLNQPPQSLNMIQPSQVSINNNSCLQQVTPISNHQTQLPNNNYNQQYLTPVSSVSNFLNSDNIQNSSLQFNTIPMFQNTKLTATNDLKDQNSILLNSQQITKNDKSPYFSTSSMSQNNFKSPWHQNLSSVNPFAAANVKPKPLNNIDSLSDFKISSIKEQLNF